MSKESKKTLGKKVKRMRMAFLESSIKRKAFSNYVIGDFKQRLSKLQNKDKRTGVR